MDIPRHNVFVSFHHGSEYYAYSGINYKKKFVRLMQDETQSIISRSVNDGDIDPLGKTENQRRIVRERFLANASVVVVLIGPDTWKRKHVDWEIGYALRKTSLGNRSGLLGLLLPTHESFNKKNYNQYTIPPRLEDNTDNGFAKIYDWNENPATFKKWIHAAFQRRNEITPDNSRPLFRNNRSQDQTQWQK